MRIVFFGTPNASVHILDALSRQEEIAGVVTQPDKPEGRGRKLAEPPVKQWAENNGLPVFQPETVKDPDFFEDLKLLSPDVIVVVAYGKILPPDVLNFPKFGCINVHYSLLPKYRGASPVQAAILSGDDETGVSIMKMDPGLDTGPVYLQRSLPIDIKDTAATLEAKLSDLAIPLLEEVFMELISGSAEPMPQPAEGASYAPLISKADARIDWSQPALVVHNRIRAMNPKPGAFTTFRGEPLKIWRSHLDDSAGSSNKEPGTLVAASAKNGLAIQCGDGVLHLLEVQPPSKSRLSAEDFVNGSRVKIGEKIGA